MLYCCINGRQRVNQPIFDSLYQSKLDDAVRLGDNHRSGVTLAMRLRPKHHYVRQVVEHYCTTSLTSELYEAMLYRRPTAQRTPKNRSQNSGTLK